MVIYNKIILILGAQIYINYINLGNVNNKINHEFNRVETGYLRINTIDDQKNHVGVSRNYRRKERPHYSIRSRRDKLP